MNTRDLDGNSVSWNITGNIVKKNCTNKSSYHMTVRNILSSLYPTMQILEEVPIHIRKSEVLYMDFYIPLLKKCVEVHGEQHYKFIPYYHSNKLSFLKAQKRDKEKKEWCDINGITYIELPYYDNEKWEELIVNN